MRLKEYLSKGIDEVRPLSDQSPWIKSYNKPSMNEKLAIFLIV